MLNFEAFRALWPGFGRALTNLECFRGRDLRFFGVCDQKCPTGLTDSVSVIEILCWVCKSGKVPVRNKAVLTITLYVT